MRVYLEVCTYKYVVYYNLLTSIPIVLRRDEFCVYEEGIANVNCPINEGTPLCTFTPDIDA